MIDVVSGLIEFTGPPDSGKSSAAIEYYKGNPKEIAFIDNDLKGQSTAEQMIRDGFPFGEYIDLRGEVIKELWEQYYFTVEKVIERLEKSKPVVTIVDGWPAINTACKAYVSKRPEVFNEMMRGEWSKNSNIRNGEISREAKKVEGWFISRILSFSKTLIITSHLKNHYLKNPKTGQGEPTGKEIPQSSDQIVTDARLRIWLTRSPGTTKPCGLVLKNIDKKVYIENVGVRTISVLPFKILPDIKLPEEDENFIANDMSIWDTIRRYWNNPVGKRSFIPQEVPNDEEKSIIDGTLTREQKIMWLSAIKSKEEEEQELKLIAQEENKTKSIELKNSGKSLMEIANELHVSIADVVKWTTEAE